MLLLSKCFRAAQAVQQLREVATQLAYLSGVALVDGAGWYLIPFDRKTGVSK